MDNPSHPPVATGIDDFRSLADNAPAMLWVTDAHGCCTFLNRRWFEFTGQSPASGLGLGWLAAVHPEELVRLHGGELRAESGGIGEGAEFIVSLPRNAA